MVYLLDSNYKIGAKNSVEEAPRILLEYEHHECLLNNKAWNYNLKKLKDEIYRQINEPSNEIDGITLKRIHTEYNIISTITRQIAWDTGKDIIVFNTGWSTEDDQVYVRSRKTDLINLIKQGKESGLIIGGKNDVIGAILPKKSTEFFIKKVINYLKNQ
jgi:nanoRNase/pAp phosphatase (c-di-AMP/oligoRNAs hydrolase)